MLKPLVIICFIITILLVFSLMGCLGCIKLGNTSDAPDLHTLEEKAREIMQLDDVTRRRNVDDLFALAAVYEEQGRHSQAIALYRDALKYAPMYLDCQLKLGRLLYEEGLYDEAVLPVLHVYTYAEDEELLRQSSELLRHLGAEVPGAVPENVPPVIEIMLVPIGDVNPVLLQELVCLMREQFGIKYTVADFHLDPGSCDRVYSPGMLERIMAFYLHGISGLRSLEEYQQYDVGRFINELWEVCDPADFPGFHGFLGITAVDIFFDSSLYHFGLAGQGYGVISYYRFTALATEETPCRPRLLERTFKQAASSTFHILELERCSSPGCVRVYAGSLEELDLKGITLCEPCNRAVAGFKEAGAPPGFSD